MPLMSLFQDGGVNQYMLPIRMEGSGAEVVDDEPTSESPHSTTVKSSSASEGLSLEIVNSNLLRLMAHLGVAAYHRGSSPLGGSSATTSPILSAAVTANFTRQKPRCPWCQSAKFSNEKNFVAHLNHADSMIGQEASSHKSCRFSAVLHSEMMGLAAGSGTSAAASAFIKGYRRHFVASEVDGFNAERCAAAQTYLLEKGIAEAPTLFASD